MSNLFENFNNLDDIKIKDLEMKDNEYRFFLNTELDEDDEKCTDISITKMN